MIATMQQQPDTRQEPELPKPAPAANPLRRGDLVVCPRCEGMGPEWEWELRQSPRYQQWTGRVYKCRLPKCGHIFSVKDAE